MCAFIASPNLPAGKVTYLALGGRYRAQLGPPLAARGVEVLWLPELTGPDARIAGHADLALLHTGGDRLVYAGTDDIVNLLTNRGFTLIRPARAPAVPYPHDCGLNVCLVGGRAVLCPRTADAAVLRLLDRSAVIPVRQGYARCAVCIVDETSVITADAGVARAAEAAGLSVLKVSQDGIALEGFSQGFIGGAAFKLSPRELAFTGVLDRHPDRGAILAFLQTRGITPRYLTDAPAFDIGSAVPLEEV